MKTTEFLDAVRARRGLTSDYQLAKFLGSRQATISRYRTGGSMMDEAMCLKIAAALELEPGAVLVAIAIEREKRVEVKTAWQRVAKRLAGTVAGILALAAGGSSLHNHSDGAIAAAAGPIYTYATIPLSRLARWAQEALFPLAAALGLTLALAGPAAAGADWTRGDVGREAVYQVALAVDCAQTRYGASHPGQFSEENPLMGAHPSKGKINNVCFAVGTGHFLLSNWLPSGARGLWQGLTIIVELYAVEHNRMAGVKIEF